MTQAQKRRATRLVRAAALVLLKSGASHFRAYVMLHLVLITGAVGRIFGPTPRQAR